MAQDSNTPVTEEQTAEAAEQEKKKESETPMTDSVNCQFDDWDKEIAGLKKDFSEGVKRRLKALQKLIKEWMTSKTESLEGDKQKTEDSPIAKALKAIQESFKSLEGAFSGMKGTIDSVVKIIKEFFKTIKAICEFIAELVKDVVLKIADLTLAIATIASRGTKTVTNCVF